MRCEAIQLEVSARLDGAEDRAMRPVVEAHVAGCQTCQAFAAGSERLRVLSRLEAAPGVPDLVPSIMARVAPARRGRAWLPAAAAFVAGAVAGAVLAGGLPAAGPDTALATEVPDRIAGAAAHVTRYRATFRIMERNFHSDVPVRRMTARVAFAAPERFRAQIRDRTAYPSGAWPRNDLLLDVDRDRWTLRGPVTCPREALPACAPGGMEERGLTGREPFDGQAPLPTDIILPLRSLAGSERVRVAGNGEVLGRATVDVDLAYRDAAPLFAYLHEGGTWRPLFPLDRVRLSLDEETWFPLAFRVFPAPGRERAAWAVRNGLPNEPPERAVLDVTAEALDTRAGPPHAVAPALGGRDLGFRDVPVDAAVPLPAHTSGLGPYRAGRTGGTSVVSYARGLSWLKVSATRSWPGPEPFGLRPGPSEPLNLPGGGRAAYQPATLASGRRVSIHAGGWDLVLESNLSRARLVAAAASVPVRGLPLPLDRRVRRLPGGAVRIGVGERVAAAAFDGLLMPRRLPAGYRIATIDLLETTSHTAVTVHAWRPGTELDGTGLVLHQSSTGDLPPPMDPGVLSVRVRGAIGRYAPDRGELEWIEGGAYRSLRSETLSLGELLAVARGLAR